MGSTTLYNLPYTVNANPANMPPEEAGMMGAADIGLAGDVATKTITEVRAGSPINTLVLDGQLRMNVIPGAVYKVDCYLMYRAATSAAVQFFAPAGSSGDFYGDNLITVGVIPSGTVNRAYSALAAPILMGPLNSSNTVQASIGGFLTIGATGGRVVIGWGPALLPDSSGTITLFSGSNMRLRRVA